MPVTRVVLRRACARASKEILSDIPRLGLEAFALPTHFARADGGTGDRRHSQAVPLPVHREASHVRPLLCRAFAHRTRLLENPLDSSALRWVGEDAFEITCNDQRARHALSPSWEFRS